MTVLDYGSMRDENRGGHWLGWAVYLGMSWTWCIGMFLPVLLVREYEVWGWVVFAIPNVVGAAVMGWVLTRQQSAKLVERHREAVEAFSIVTVAFQMFFLAWFVSWRPVNAVSSVLGAAALAVVFLWATRWRVMAWVVFVASIGFWILAQPTSFNDQAWDMAKHYVRMMAGTVPVPPLRLELLPLAAVCVFGFALCPYLDGTFHAAREALEDSKSRLAFSIGFGVFFLSMILFTLQYAIEGIWRGPAWYWMTAMWVAPHVITQLAFTIGVHIDRGGRRARVAAIALVIAAVAVIGMWMGAGGEMIYRLFMSFYGLVFPAYVWLCMLPTWNNPQRPSRRQWGVFAMSVMLAAPAFWVGFILGRMMWVLPGLAIVLLSRLLISTRPAGELRA